MPRGNPTERPDVVGVVLAGGLARRIGGDKAAVALGGRPLLGHVVDVLREVFSDVSVVAKPDTTLPVLAVEPALWIEPRLPRHPLSGVVHALRCADGRPVFVCATDLPLLDAATIRAVLDADDGARPVVAAQAEGRLQPLCALYRPEALAALATFDPDEAATAAVERIGVRAVPIADPTPLFNVNTPDELLTAAAILDGRGGVEGGVSRT